MFSKNKLSSLNWSMGMIWHFIWLPSFGNCSRKPFQSWVSKREWEDLWQPWCCWRLVKAITWNTVTIPPWSMGMFTNTRWPNQKKGEKAIIVPYAICIKLYWMSYYSPCHSLLQKINKVCWEVKTIYFMETYFCLLFPASSSNSKTIQRVRKTGKSTLLKETTHLLHLLREWSAYTTCCHVIPQQEG